LIILINTRTILDKKAPREIHGRSYVFSVEMSPDLDFSDLTVDEDDFEEVDSVITNGEFLLYFCTGLT
jgi:hypothetical protein